MHEHATPPKTVASLRTATTLSRADGLETPDHILDNVWVFALFGILLSLGVLVWRSALKGDVEERAEEVRMGKTDV